MALIKCPKCGQEISDKAKKCIHCGNVLTDETEVLDKIKCSNCGNSISDDDHLVWKCTSCNKAFKVSLSKLRKMCIQKNKPEYVGRMLLKCPICGMGMDDGNEKIAYKCPVCENVMTGNLKCFAEEKKAVNNTILCLECGKEISDDVKECPNCGCPVEEQKDSKPQQVEVASIKIAAKTRKIILIGLFLMVLCIAGGMGYKKYINNINEKEYRESYNSYIADLQKIQVLMLAGGSDAESLCNLTLRVWGNAISKEDDSETDKYTKKNKTDFNDFNTALMLLYIDDKTQEKVSSINSNQTSVKELIKGMQNPPEGLDKCYDTVSDLYESYKILTDLAVNPTGSYRDFGDKKNDAITDFMSFYEKLDNQIPEKMEVK